MDWLLIGIILFFFAFVLVMIGGFLYITSSGEKKRLELSRSLLYFSLILFTSSFVVTAYNEFTIYDRAPVYQDTITVSETEFVRVQSARAATLFECVIYDEKTTIPFVFSSTDRGEAKMFCDDLEISSKQKVTFKDVRGKYYIVSEEK